jgi:hypothetical protein
MLEYGKGVLLWQGRTCDPDPLKIVVQAKQMGLGWIGPKAADGGDLMFATYTKPEMKLLVKHAHEEGIKVVAWHYVYGGLRASRDGRIHLGYASAEKEAYVMIKEIQEIGYDALLVDAEREYKIDATKTGDRKVRAITYMQTLRRELGSNYPIGLCSYRYPNLHPELPWDEFLGRCNFHAPQVYWNPKGSPMELITSIARLKARKNLPFLPIGRAYIGDGHPGIVKPETTDNMPNEITAFLKACKDGNLMGAGFWSWDAINTHPGGQERRKAISDFVWKVLPAPIIPPPPVSDNLRDWARAVDIWLRENSGWAGPQPG